MDRTEDLNTAVLRDKRKTYASPKLVTYGKLQELTRGNGGGKHDNAGAAGTRPCWIAEELYGPDDLRTHLLRAWLVMVYSRQSLFGAAVLAAYRLFGRPVAKWIHHWHLLRRLWFPVFDRAVVAAQRSFMNS